MRKTDTRSSKAFTIVELVAVIIILGIALAPFGVMFQHIMVKYAEPEIIQVATALAEGEIERVTGLRFSEIADEGPTAFTNFPNYTFQVWVSAISGQPDTDEYKQVEVQVTNSSAGVTVSLFTMATIKQDVS